MSQVAVLIEKLNAQIQSGEQVDSFIDALQMFVDHREDEEIVGLEDKLAYVGRSDEIKSALKKKELFQKKLMALEPFSSAQKIFAIFLSRNSRGV
ncbi:hypothetical protein EJ074_15800 [Mesorhizobium sp. M3A.F.Ca.ET.080.04.2.1]|uniref:ABC-three component system protein n=1 Tax=Mesorhizobium sp. M3A.F.Ca.ET.080.04.2.1 TaxID=2493676 RepID=UPI000F76248E|nr:ABC-three component system protein [Mesorhizobium sp. M3A.F.Ca.ET.080.04.2.1]AZO10427.1 hypothetical protein EJ074_15800 [Mesorhizobium sp. M3A.F.Ca.ET.080.04.2.1]RWF19886.1 MAG: hypothetical protein EOS64_18660 [Mesorhizobium sp.]